MSKKACIIFSVWTSFFSALFYHIYGFMPALFANFGVDFAVCGWIMFVCLAIYFGIGLTPKDFPSAVCSAAAGLAWGQFDFFLGNLLGKINGVGPAAAMFASILIATTITMYIHIYVLENTPFRQMPFIFAGVCLTFSQGGTNEPALITTFIFGLVLCTICTFMLGFAMHKWPRQSD